MFIAWSAKEDIIVRRAFRAGMKDADISAFLAENGFSRSAGAIKSRRLDYLNLKALPNAIEPEPGVLETPIPDYRSLDDAFCAALREHHPDKETGPLRTECEREVPFRWLPSPMFWSTGLMVP